MGVTTCGRDLRSNHSGVEVSDHPDRYNRPGGRGIVAPERQKDHLDGVPSAT